MMYEKPKEDLEIELVNFHHFMRGSRENETRALAQAFIRCTSLAISGVKMSQYWGNHILPKKYI